MYFLILTLNSKTSVNKTLSWTWKERLPGKKLAFLIKYISPLLMMFNATKISSRNLVLYLAI